jgi:hypothetical protein
MRQLNKSNSSIILLTPADSYRYKLFMPLEIDNIKPIPLKVLTG